MIATTLTLAVLATAPLDASRIIPAIASTETTGQRYAVGDNGRSLGPLQITLAVVQDVNRVTGSRYRHTDAFDRRKAELIFLAYIAHYATAERLGRQPTLEDAARIWNGGPNGWKKAATVRYWAKVRARL